MSKSKRNKVSARAARAVAGICRVCGCTDDAACDGGCSWSDATETICSNCVEPKPILLSTTDRGFMHGEFRDCYRGLCCVTESSSASDHRIWLGVKSIQGSQYDPKMTGPVCMHLSREMVAGLIPLLRHFVKTGRLPR